MIRPIAAILASGATLLAIGAATTPPAAAEPTDQPNIVVLMVDDQPAGLMDAMPFTQHTLFRNGMRMTNGMIPTSLCCPSRAAFLSGWLANTTGVWSNKGVEGGGYADFQPFEDQTIAKAVDDEGYYTALVGKYLNEFNELVPDVSYVPPGWDEFRAMQPDNPGRDAVYYNYRLRGTADNSIHYPSDDPASYSTDVLGDQAVDVIEGAPADQPLFLYFSPFGVHPPWNPAPRHFGTWPLEPESAIPGLDEADVSDKPAWVQKLDRVDPLAARRDLTRQHEMSMSVDEAIAQIHAALGDRADNTLFIYLSDNGYMHGAHRLQAKDVPYNLSTHVSMALRWDGHLLSGPNDRITTNVDLTATIAAAAGAPWDRDGRSVLTTGRSGTVLEQIKNGGHPAYCGWRSKRYMFVQYTGDKGHELYDYRKDPAELHNRIDRQGYADQVARLQANAQEACDPVPPGFTW